VPASGGVTAAATDFHEAPKRRGLRYAATRLATIGDQVVVALTNFALTLAIGRAFGADELAAYGIGLSIALMVQGLQRHTITIPLLLKPAARVQRRRGAVIGAQALILFTALAAMTAALLLAQAIAAPRFVHLVLAASAVCLLVYLELEFARAFLTKIGRPALLLAGAAFYALVAASLAFAALTQRISFETMLFVLGGAMLLHAGAVLAVSGTLSLRDGARLLGLDIKRYGGWAAAATATYAGYNHVPLLIVGAIAAPIHAAVFVAARSLLQPLQIVLRGLDVADKSAFAELRAHPWSRKTARFTLTLVVLYALIGGVIGIAVGLGAERLMMLAYGPKFAGQGSALVAWVPAYILLSVSTPLESLVYARKAFRGYFAIRGLASVVAIAAAFPLVAWHGGVGAVIACAIGWLVAVAGTGLMLARGRPPE
jgi:O-antigen/teichoic acid export membrane protein